MWNKSDDELVEQATQRAGTCWAWSTRPWSRPATWCACPRPTPSTTRTYRANVAVLRAWLEANAPNVHPVGRNGMHKYNNQDHSMYTAMLTVENILGADHDIWNVNVEEEYHEQARPARRRSSARAPGATRR